jgi:hypothetical protein
MPPSLTSGSSIIVSVQNSDVDIGLRHGPKGSALPIIPQSVSRGARFSWLRWFATATACQVARPPVRIRLVSQPTGAFTSRLSAGRSPFPLLGMTTTVTGLLVWGFFCQGVSAERPIFLPSLVSLFDLKARFFVPTRHSGKPSHAGAVKAGRLLRRPPAGLGLDSSEHGGTIECSRAGSARRRSEGSPRSGADLSRHNLVFGGSKDPNHDAVMRIGSEAPRRRTHSLLRRDKPWSPSGHHHLEPSSATHHKRTGWAKTVGCLLRPPVIVRDAE